LIAEDTIMRGLTALTLVLLVACAPPPTTDDTSAEPRAAFDGTWQLVSTTQTMADGSTRPDPDIGDHGVGQLMLDASNGRMCVTVANGDRTRWADALQPTDAEVRESMTRMVAYCGTWSVDTAKQELVYKLEIDRSPNQQGTERRRQYVWKGDHLLLNPTPLPEGVTKWEIEWKRSS
jgi:hypothetical protein